MGWIAGHGLIIGIPAVLAASYLSVWGFFSFFSGPGGLAALAAAYPAGEHDRPERVVSGRTVHVGAVAYKRISSVGLNERGLWFSVSMPGAGPVFIPWTICQAPYPKTLYWEPWVCIPVGSPVITTLCLPPDCREEVNRYLGQPG